MFLNIHVKKLVVVWFGLDAKWHSWEGFAKTEDSGCISLTVKEIFSYQILLLRHECMEGSSLFRASVSRAQGKNSVFKDFRLIIGSLKKCELSARNIAKNKQSPMSQ